MQRAYVNRAGQFLAVRLSSAVPALGACRHFVARSALSVSAAPLHNNRRFASSSSSSQPSAAQRSHYRCLGIDTDATPQEVKAAYRQLALRYHPDVAAEEHRAQSEFLFRRVSEAYEVLSDPVKRRAHDSELGVQTSRKQSPPTAASASPASASTSPQARGMAARTAHNKRRAASAAPSSDASRRQQQRSYRKPFVRGDANRVFVDAFDGKTLDEILFDVQRRRRQATTAAATTPTTAASSGVDVPASALDREARLRHVMEDAAESFAVKAQRQYGQGILRHIRATAHTLPTGPAPAPDAYMPFRPFVGMEVPAGVQTPPEAQQGRVLTPQEATIEPPTVRGSDAEKPPPAQFHTHQYADGAYHSRFASMQKASRNIEGMAHNMGQLYSYQRPY